MASRSPGGLDPDQLRDRLRRRSPPRPAGTRAGDPKEGSRGSPPRARSRTDPTPVLTGTAAVEADSTETVAPSRATPRAGRAGRVVGVRHGALPVWKGALGPSDSVDFRGATHTLGSEAIAPHPPVPSRIVVARSTTAILRRRDRFENRGLLGFGGVVSRFPFVIVDCERTAPGLRDGSFGCRYFDRLLMEASHGYSPARVRSVDRDHACRRFRFRSR